MKVGVGFKTHSGWAVAVVVGEHDGEWTVADRRRVELVEAAWAKQPYHAAEGRAAAAARKLVARGVASANRLALRETRALVERERQRGNAVVGCGVLVGEPMPDWSTDEILAVHFRMHKAEGALFQSALVRAAEAAGLATIAVHEKTLAELAAAALGTPSSDLVQRVATLGKRVGPPWGKDQKSAAMAALIALRSRPRRGAGSREREARR